MTNPALMRTGATYSRKARAMGTTTSSENCDPMAMARETPSSTIRRQFQSTTSRGAYNVCATAIAVKIVPNAPQVATISGSVCQTALAWISEGEKQYRVRAMNPPVFPQRRRATYHKEAPRNMPQARNGSRGSHRQIGADSADRSRGHARRGAAETR